MAQLESNAAAIASAFTASEINVYLKDAITVQMNGGTVTRGFEGGTMTISFQNCENIIRNCREALNILAAEEDEEDPVAVAPALSRGVDFSYRPCY